MKTGEILNNVLKSIPLCQIAAENVLGGRSSWLSSLRKSQSQRCCVQTASLCVPAREWQSTAITLKLSPAHSGQGPKTRQELPQEKKNPKPKIWNYLIWFGGEWGGGGVCFLMDKLQELKAVLRIRRRICDSDRDHRNAAGLLWRETLVALSSRMSWISLQQRSVPSAVRCQAFPGSAPCFIPRTSLAGSQ